MAAPRRKAGTFYNPNVLLKNARLRVDEAAALLEVHSSTVRRWIETEKIPSLRMPGGQIRIRTGTLTKYLRRGAATSEGAEHVGGGAGGIIRAHADRGEKETS